MMGNTHITVGIATAVITTQPQTLNGCLTAVLGGAIGGLICDIDTKANQYGKDTLLSRIIVIALATAILLSDRLMNTGIWEYILSQSGTPLFTGTLLFAALFLGGLLSPHRTFMHSLPALALMDVALNMLYPPIVPCFTVGFLSHIALDLLNKKPIRLLYPLPLKCCFKLFYSDGFANNVILFAAVIADIALLFYYITRFIPI